MIDAWVGAHIRAMEWLVTCLGSTGVVIVSLCLLEGIRELLAVRESVSASQRSAMHILARGNVRMFSLLGINTLFFLLIGVTSLDPHLFIGARGSILVLGIITVVTLEQILCALWLLDRRRGIHMVRTAQSPRTFPTERTIADGN